MTNYNFVPDHISTPSLIPFPQTVPGGQHPALGYSSPTSSVFTFNKSMQYLFFCLFYLVLYNASTFISSVASDKVFYLPYSLIIWPREERKTGHKSFTFNRKDMRNTLVVF